MIVIPEENKQIKKAALFVAATQDHVCRADIGKMTMKRFAPHAEIVDVEAGHWVQLERSEEVNQALERWIGSLSLRKAEL